MLVSFKLDLLFSITLAISLQGFVDAQKRTLYVPLYSSLTEKEIHSLPDKTVAGDCCVKAWICHENIMTMIICKYMACYMKGH